MGANIRTRPRLSRKLDIVRRSLGGRNGEFRPAVPDHASEPGAASGRARRGLIGASAAPAIDRTARLAEGWIASPGLTPEEARVQADLYRERCAAYGKEPGAIVLRRDIYAGESSPEARRWCCRVR
jgi:alkanesulfonate monooxygenase SsuD/methylene tetrahydromethanopterin reductase-like flavin-dependent oxidoreductase (luciferase family)